MIDEAYWGFGSKDNAYVKPYIDEFPNLVICRTFSKYYALAGLRIGYAFAGKNLEELINFSIRYLGFNRISENLAEIAMDDEAMSGYDVETVARAHKVAADTDVPVADEVEFPFSTKPPK